MKRTNLAVGKGISVPKGSEVHSNGIIMELEIEVSIVLPCYNEKENLEILPEIISKIGERINDFEILVVDDSSPDGTAKFVGKLGEIDPRVKLVLREKKEGIGAALRHGYDELMKTISPDADLSFKVDDILRLIDKISEVLILLLEVGIQSLHHMKGEGLVLRSRA